MLTRTSIPFLFAFVLTTSVGRADAQIASEIAQPPNGNNQRAEVSQWIGLVKVTVAYHSPRVHFPASNDRTGHIWGELVKYGFFDEGFGPSHATPWRAGANETTTLSLSHDVQIGGKELKAGTYALFLALDAKGPWTWIISNKPVGWGSFQYDPANDVLRVPATPTDAPLTEFLTYGFDDRLPNAATLFLQWEKKRVDLKIDVPNINDLYIAQIRKDLEAWPGFNYQNWAQAAQFAVANNVDLDEALVWADKALYEPFRNAAAGRVDFSTLATKAAVLVALHRDVAADSVMDQALRLPGVDARMVNGYGQRLLQQGRTAKAMEIFRLNRQLHPDEKFWTYVGLARGFTALGDKKSAIANWETALKSVPPSQAANRPTLERALEALRSGR